MSDWRPPPSAAPKGGASTPPNPAVAALMRQAFGLHQQGLLNDAERLYREVLAKAPEQPDALHFLGVIESQRGRNDAAIALMDRALAGSPGNIALLYNRANALHHSGRLADALQGYDAALALKPANAAVLNNRGTVLQSVGRNEEALQDYDRALAVKPDHVDALSNRGNVLIALDRFADAVASFDHALRIAPKHFPAHYGRGNALVRLNRTEDALASYDRALDLTPGNPEILNNCGNVLGLLSRYDEAIACFDRAIAAAPQFAQAYNNRGNIMIQARRFAEALASYDHALALKPGYAEALYGRGSVLIELKRHDEAIADLEHVLQLAPDYPYAAGMLAFAQSTSCDWRGNGAAAVIEGVRAGKRVATPLALLAISDSPADKLRCAQTVMAHKFPPTNGPTRRGDSYHHRHIRLAYLTADFGNHPVAVQMAGVFEHHDRARFEIIAVSLGTDDASDMRKRLNASVDRIIDARGTSDRDIAAMLRGLEIDIAVDLTGLTSGGRPGILLQRPAPVQASHLGFAGSHGASHIDYIIADRTVIPEDQVTFYSEKIAYLPDSFMPHDSKRAIAGRTPSRAEQGLPDQGFVFASFNNSYKFTALVFDIWMRLLSAIEGSVLWLPATNPAATRNLKREAEARGVMPDRIVFAERVPSAADHLARLRLADLFLDTLPYNAHSTACDALWAGLPVLTCQGESFAARVAASVLKAAGLPELITGALPEYEAMALRLANEPANLAAIRTKLRAGRDSCALFDTPRFTRNLESAYATMWERARNGQQPESFAVEPVASRPL